MKDDIKLLRELGFSEYESKALLALLARGEATAPQISSISGVPGTKIYTVLKAVNEYLWESPKGTRPRTYRAIDIKSIVDRIVKKKARYIDELKSRKAEIIARLETVASSGKAYETEENLVWFVNGLESVHHEIAKLAQGAQKAMYTISTPRDWVTGHSNMEIITSWIEAVVDRGVKSSEIQPRMSLEEYEEVEKVLKGLIGKLDVKAFQVRASEYFSKDTLKIGEISRKNAHFTMVIKDDDVAFIGLRHPYSATSEAGLIINDKKVVKGLQDYFRLNLWPKTVPTKNTLKEVWLRAIMGTKIRA